jgi:hypothetical protein
VRHFSTLDTQTQKGSRPFLPIGKYHSKGSAGGITLAQGYKKAADLSTLYQTGVRDLPEHFANLDSQIISELQAKKLAIANAEQVKTLEDSRKTTVRTLFDNWVKVELQPHIRTDGKRIGRKDGGQSEAG